jgi:nucleotide-binding universal stress UspA family protein
MSIDHDVVVIGAIGRSGTSKILRGSAAEKIARVSKIPS